MYLPTIFSLSNSRYGATINNDSKASLTTFNSFEDSFSVITSPTEQMYDGISTFAPFTVM